MLDNIGVSQRPFVQMQKESMSFDSLLPHLERGGEWLSFPQPLDYSNLVL